jgi:hypothetical protein
MSTDQRLKTYQADRDLLDDLGLAYVDGRADSDDLVTFRVEAEMAS